MKKIMFNDKYGLTKAVLEGRKTMTRRIANPISENIDKMGKSKTIRQSYRIGLNLYYPKFEVGEIVAVAERYSVLHERLNEAIREKRKDDSLEAFYRASICDTDAGWNKKMYVRADLMPHQIRITNVRIEKLQSISDEDCIKEGIYKTIHKSFGYPPSWRLSTFRTKVYERFDAFSKPQNAFAVLIDKISGKNTWKSNPYVFVYEFELIK